MRMLWNFFVHAAATAFGLLIVTAFVPGVTLTTEASPAIGDGSHDRLWAFLGAGAIVAALNMFIKPIFKLIGLPLTILTLGLFCWVINAVILLIAAGIAQAFGLGLSISGFWAALFGAIVLGVVNAVVSPITSSLERN